MRGETGRADGRGSRRAHFNPLPSCEGRPTCSTASTSTPYFNPLPSCEGRLEEWIEIVKKKISIHSPHARGDRVLISIIIRSILFQSTPLTRGETFTRREKTHIRKFQSTPLTRGETLVNGALTLKFVISIHSPHARGDPIMHSISQLINISIHSPHARGDLLFKFGRK